MQRWQAIPVAVGGVVAVGFLDEDRIIVGSHSGQPDFRIEDQAEYRAQGFSPEGSAFVYATSPTVYLVTRRT